MTHEELYRCWAAVLAYEDSPSASEPERAIARALRLELECLALADDAVGDVAGDAGERAQQDQLAPTTRRS